MKNLRALGIVSLLSLVALAAILPAYGANRATAVTHPEWARLLLKGLDLDAGVAADEKASTIFTALSWHSSLAIPAEKFVKADGMQAIQQPIQGLAAEGAKIGSASYALTVPRAGDYTVRVKLAGDPAKPASAELARRGETAPFTTFTLKPAATVQWVEGGRVHLDPGAYTASVLLPPGAALDLIEVAPPCVTSIEPMGGWKPASVATTSDVAVTVMRALEREYELAPAGAPIELPGSAIQQYAPSLVQASAGSSFKGGDKGAEGLLTFDVPEDGVYTIWSSGTLGGGQRWLGDVCHKSVLCGGASPRAKVGEWWPVQTSALSAGHHSIVVRLGAGGSVDRVRIERKKTDKEAYVDALRRAGLDVGAEGPISRSAAADAMDFVKRERVGSMGAPCGDVPPPAKTPTTAGQTVASNNIQQPGQTPLGSGEPPPVPGVSPFLPVGEIPSPVQ